MILAADVGGTKTVLALYEDQDGRLERRHETVYASADYDSLESIVEVFRRQQPDASIEAFGAGVAGPVIDGRAATTNLPWELEEVSLGRSVGLSRALLLNDLEASAYGMLDLGPDERVVLNPPREAGRRGHAAVIAAGTGLGEAYLVWNGERYHALPSEGGHASFSPTTEEQVALLRFLREEFGHVSTERVLSGPGLYNVYRFARAASGEPEPAWLSERFASEDPPAVVGQLGVADEEPVCRHSVELFASIYGAEAGDMALQCVAVGGVYVGGGIAPKLLPVLQAGGFLAAFSDKGRFQELLSGFEVSVSLDLRTPLRGAARQVASRGS